MSTVYSAYQVAELAGIPLSRLRYIETEFRDLLGSTPAQSPRGVSYTEKRIALLRQLHELHFNRRLAPADVRRMFRDEASREQVRVVAVTSGKGGVGKTTVAVNLATAAARSGRRTLLVDCDLGLANVHVQAGVQPERTLLDFVGGAARIEEVITVASSNLHIVCGGSGEARLADLDLRWMEHLQGELSRLCGSYEQVILDTGAGISSQVVRFLGLADEILIVVTPNLSSILDAYGVIKTARREQLKAQLTLLVNQARDESQALDVAARIEACARRFLDFAPGYAGYLLSDPAVEESHQQRRALVVTRPDGDNSRMLAHLARNLSAKRRRARETEAGVAVVATG